MREINAAYDKIQDMRSGGSSSGSSYYDSSADYGDTDAYEASLSEAISISNFFIGEENTKELIEWLNKKIA